jgi:protein-disulfide isomerase
MARICILGTALAAMLISNGFARQDHGAPKIDKQRLETYLRYAEAYTSEVKFTIDDPTPSAYPGYYRVLVHLTHGPSKLDRVYYITGDGRHLINGAVWDVNENPFVDILEHLPMDGPSFGPANAKVTIVVFSDFECPYCRELAHTIRSNVGEKYPNDVRVIYEDFPIDAIHKWARAAAEAGRCIAEQKVGAFWAFHDWIFEHQQEVNETNLRDKALTIAKEQNLDGGKVSGCIDNHATAQQVRQSEEQGAALQIQQTPTLFVNGRMLPGAVDWKTLEAVIQLELKRPKEIPAAAAKCCEVTMPTITKK